MTMVLLRAADHVGVSIPAWETCWRPYCLGRRVPFTWLPIPSTLPVLEDRDGVSQLRERLTRSGAAVVGHFGTYGRYVADLLRPVLVAVLKREPGCVVLLLGRESDVFRDRLAAAHPEFATRLHATGALESAGISRHLQACDVLVQPYPDGVSSRRTTAMAALAHGLPLVTNQGRLTEVIWAESQAAALTPAGEADTLAAAVCTLLSDPARRQALGRAGKTLYEQRFAPRHTLAALRRLAGEVVT
jgi:glycosyltransferase involved in cell wall biosynthesis